MEDMKRRGICETMSGAFKHLELPDFQVKDEGAKNSRSYSKGMDKEVRRRLRDFYAPHDKKLFDVLKWDKHPESLGGW